MVHVTSVVAARDLVHADASVRKHVTLRGLLRRLFDAMIEARRRQVEREIGRYLRNTGGKLTDDVERTIERRFLTTL